MCFIWLGSKLPREKVSIMLRITCFDHDSRNAPPDANKFHSETCSIHDQTNMFRAGANIALVVLQLIT